MSEARSDRGDTRTLKMAVDLPALLTHMGVDVMKEGGRLKARCWQGTHEDQHPSVVVDADNRRGFAPGYKCFSCGAHGDALQAVEDRMNVDFAGAKEYIRRFLGLPHDQRAPTPAVQPPRPVVAEMTTADQVEAASYAWATLGRLVPGGTAAGHRYLAMVRHVDPTTADPKGGIMLVPGSAFKALPAIALRERKADLLLAAGLLIEKKERLSTPWFDDTLLAPCTKRDGHPLYLWGRRTNPERFLPRIRYLNQSVDRGARWCPYGLEAIRRASTLGLPLRVVEGPITALGSESLIDGQALPTMAMMTRPGWASRAGITFVQERFWSAVAPDMARLSEVQIVPDCDDTQEKNKTGLEHATNLAAWLRSRSVPARVVTMSDLGYDQKDLANVAAQQRQGQESASVAMR